MNPEFKIHEIAATFEVPDESPDEKVYNHVEKNIAFVLPHLTVEQRRIATIAAISGVQCDCLGPKRLVPVLAATDAVFSMIAEFVDGVVEAMPNDPESAMTVTRALLKAIPDVARLEADEQERPEPEGKPMRPGPDELRL